MKISKDQVVRWLDNHPQFKKRSLMYQATADFLEITPDQVERAITFHRRLQGILPPDIRGNQLEAQHLADEGYVSKETARSGQVNIGGSWYRIAS